jgi:2-isopropylmalate synthase
MTLKIYDTTLRDGGQAAEVSLSKSDHIALFKVLDSFHLDYIEVGWPTSAGGDNGMKEIFKECLNSAKYSKVVAFGSTSKDKNPENDQRLNDVLDAGAQTICLFGKTWIPHADLQLKITPEENLEVIGRSVDYIRKKGRETIYDAEHFFDGFKDNKEYALETLVRAARAGAQTLVLCDTNGGTMTDDFKEIVREIFERLEEKGIDTPLGVHTHNDCGLALANGLSVLKYIKQIQGTMHGKGERAGNMSLAAFLGNYSIKMGNPVRVDIQRMKEVYESSCRLSGIAPDLTHPFVGKLAFAHRGGVHVDALEKGGENGGFLYQHMQPELVGNSQISLLTTLGGKAGVIKAAREHGYKFEKGDSKLLDAIGPLFEHLRKMEDEGAQIAWLPAMHFLLFAEHFDGLPKLLDIKDSEVYTSKANGKERSNFYCKGTILKDSREMRFDEFEDIVTVPDDGPIRAVDLLLKKVVGERFPIVKNLEIADYHTSIAKSNGAASTVRTVIDFKNGELFETSGVDKNKVYSGIAALEAGYNYVLTKALKEGKLLKA